ncbi:accessory gland peptide 62F [Drosophila persimilis]|uniref:Accessory gland peptide 62F n=1 Tax=Drosophila persimilis TaxID=7234 RepID=B4GDB4_DROPE|nr:accessory gland peptide 62F [Drosophila persimilis]
MHKLHWKYICLVCHLLGIVGSASPEQPEVDCTVNGTLALCPSPCPETCEFLSETCTNECGGPCVCKEGYIIDGDLRICVLRSDCPVELQQTTIHLHYPVNIKYFGSYLIHNDSTDYKSWEVRIRTIRKPIALNED